MMLFSSVHMNKLQINVLCANSVLTNYFALLFTNCPYLISITTSQSCLNGAKIILHGVYLQYLAVTMLVSFVLFLPTIHHKRFHGEFLTVISVCDFSIRFTTSISILMFIRHS